MYAERLIEQAFTAANLINQCEFALKKKNEDLEAALEETKTVQGQFEEMFQIMLQQVSETKDSNIIQSFNRHQGDVSKKDGAKEIQQNLFLNQRMRSRAEAANEMFLKEVTSQVALLERRLQTDNLKTYRAETPKHPMDLLRENYASTRCYGNGAYLNDARQWPSFKQLKGFVELSTLRISEIDYALRDNSEEIIGVQVILNDGQQSDILGAYQH